MSVAYMCPLTHLVAPVTLPPGSGVLVCEILLDEEQRGPSRAFLQALSMTEGSQRSASQYTLLLGQHGFTQTHLKHTNNLLDAVLFVKE